MKDGQLDPAELAEALMVYGINLNDKQIQALLKTFDKNGNGTLSYDEFLSALRGVLNENRLVWVRLAYKKLDVTQDGKVCLDDIAKLYNADFHPDVIAGKATPKDVFMKFLSMWDTQTPDGIVTFDEFCDYYKDVSASVDEDEYFGAMMKSAWKLE